jgi:hypothetical protein
MSYAKTIAEIYNTNLIAKINAHISKLPLLKWLPFKYEYKQESWSKYETALAEEIETYGKQKWEQACSEQQDIIISDLPTIITDETLRNQIIQVLKKQPQFKP